MDVKQKGKLFALIIYFIVFVAASAIIIKNKNLHVSFCSYVLCSEKFLYKSFVKCHINSLNFKGKK